MRAFTFSVLPPCWTWMVITIPLWSLGCERIDPPTFKEPLVLGEEVYSSETLNWGQRVYRSYCRSCHGPMGDGMGALGVHQNPKPRDFRLGLIKYGSVTDGGLATKDDYRRIIRRGVNGTAMLPIRLSIEEEDAVIAYIKFFSQRWRKQKAGRPVTIPPVPAWVTQPNPEQLKYGAQLFFKKAQCSTCHPSPEQPVAKTAQSVYGPLTAPDLREHTYRAGFTAQDIYRTIAVGITGSPMPGWHSVLSEEEHWALVSYLLQKQPQIDGVKHEP